jgi:hypothetical protein
MKYRKKPVVIEAMQLESDNVSKILEWMGGKRVHSGGYDSEGMPFITINTLEGQYLAKPGDFIIKGVKGEFYPIKEDIFNIIYEKAGENNTLEQDEPLQKMNNKYPIGSVSPGLCR